MTNEAERALVEALANVTQRIERYAQRGPCALFPDEVVVRSMLAKMACNLVEYGHPYCPCREVTGDVAVDRGNTCPCRSHHKDIARDGHCECRLFVSEAFLQARENQDQQ